MTPGWRFIADIQRDCPLDALPPTDRADLRGNPPTARRARLQARAWLHQVLGEVLGEPPANLILDRTPQGKPALRDHPHLHINLSHSRGAALIGWGPQPVGVDLEAQGRVLRDGIAARILHPAERAIWSALAPADRDAWLLQVWVRKEAVAKADGRGIALGLARIDQTNAAVALPGGGHWTLADLPLPAGWVGAMAVAASPPA